MHRMLGLTVRGCVAMLLATFAAIAQNVSFVLQPDIPFVNTSISIVSGDFNGDGKPDLVVAGGSSIFTLLLNNGAGGFIAKSIETALPLGVEAAADLNKDGKLDLVMRGQDGLTYLLFGNGDGTFRQPSSGISGRVKLVADFNWDGYPDLLVLAGNGFAVRLGNGDGTFRQPSATAASWASHPYPSPPLEISTGTEYLTSPKRLRTTTAFSQSGSGSEMALFGRDPYSKRRTITGKSLW